MKGKPYATEQESNIPFFCQRVSWHKHTLAEKRDIALRSNYGLTLAAWKVLGEEHESPDTSAAL